MAGSRLDFANKIMERNARLGIGIPWDYKPHKPSNSGCFICQRGKINGLCSGCVQKLTETSLEQGRALYQQAKELGLSRGCHGLILWFGEGVTQHERKTKKFERNLARTRPVRTVRPSRHQGR